MGNTINRKIEWDILRKLLVIPTLKQHSNIRNKRGELDLSLFKEYITKDVTTLRLVRGNMISDNCIIDTNKEYVRLDFLDKNQKIIYFTTKEEEDWFANKFLICPKELGLGF